MDQSSYNNIYRNASPMNPGTPNSAVYQANVNRTKTRKWVEAKTQNYDGDDWGNDFDDEDDDDENEPPPPKPTGLRYPGQTAPVIQNQPPISQSSRASSQPAAAFGHGSGDFSGTRSPSGPPSLHIQTRQPSPTNPARSSPMETTLAPMSDPRSRPNMLERVPSEQLASPQSGDVRPFATGAAYPGRRDYSPASQSRASPAPQSAGPTHSRFPPRKSSMGQQDAPELPDMSGARSGSRPGSSSSASAGRPWMEQRSNSPGRPVGAGTAAGTGAGTPTKPLPFIRPADIYRRMEEEQEKVRRSIDSGRPSMDSIPGASSERSESPANAIRAPIDQRRRISFEKDDGSDTSRGLKPTLSTVAERRSEYGMERMINEPNAGPANEARLQDSATRTKESLPSAAKATPIIQATTEQPFGTHQDAINERRMSISPRLPDLARMSGFGFGDDFFSTSARGSNAGTQVRAANLDSSAGAGETQFQYHNGPEASAAVPRSVSQAEDIRTDSSEATPTQQPKGPPKYPVNEAPSLIEGPALAGEKAVLSSSSAEGANAGFPSPALDDKPVPPPKDPFFKPMKLSRPSIPGGWVSETINIDSEAPTPMELPDPKRTQLSVVQDTEVSPVAVPEADDIEPTTKIKHAPSLLNRAPNTVAEIQARHGNSADGFGDATGKHDQALVNEVISAGPEHHSMPQSLPPLQTSNSLLTSNPPAVDHGIPGSSEVRSPSFTDSPSKHSTSGHPGTAVTPSESFIPTAPLNPRRGDVEAANFVAPGFLPRNMTTSSVETATTPNESDQLREDIIKSLSPVHTPSAAGLAGPPSSIVPRHKESPVMVRDSIYLSDVYDDYMGPTEDKALQETGQASKDEARSWSESPLPALALDTTSRDATPTPAVAYSTPAKTPGHEIPALTKRFSWEQGPEQVTLSPTDELQAVPFGAESIEEARKSPVSTVSTSIDHGGRPAALTPALHVDSENGGTMSHQVSLLSSHAQGGLGVVGLDPPSPVSVMSAERSPLPAPINSEKRMSLADEKTPFQTSSQPVSPSPPRGEHPALAEPAGSAASSSPAGASATPVAPGSKQLNIMGWRDILSLPSSDIRSQKFEEARWQYSSMDSGLSNWIEHMKRQAEHTALPISHGAPQPGLSGAQPSPKSMQAPTQPYYQQYMNASNPNIAGAPPGPGRASTGNLLSYGQQPSSGFGSGGNQVGTKSKELLQAAGAFSNKATKSGIKSGMKLFNKGKSKFRGDKDQ
ncbi:hypothetical protein BJ170DRAFT_315282 [Xylariales sp. AK1849]|nr:hypothetical protein BJ170DRAFT_315282 [Xylariales sp. AK1849]